MTNSEWQPVRGTLMTSSPIKAYGGFSIPRTALRSFAEELNTGGVPFHLDHDASKPLRMRSFKAFVATRDDGVDELRFTAELHEDDLPWLNSRPGVSATLMVPLPRDRSRADPDTVTIQFGADHAWFSDGVLLDVESELVSWGVGRDQISVRRAYQFSLVPDPQIYLDITYAIFVSLSAGVLWGGIKKVFGQRRTPEGGDATKPTSVNISLVDGNRRLTAVVTTSDEEIAHRAVESLDGAIEGFFQSREVRPGESKRSAVTSWDDEAGRWTPPT